ncbi:MAG: DUF2868 domain-containing protein [Sinobacteraceae bacterium]|nr:DUF2868 domain-containing protein [Nevskiaceae bacterium]
MHQRALRTVLLIQVIEETDRTGEVIPLADRADASRTVVRESPKLSGARLREVSSSTTQAEAQASALLTRESETFLVRRAEYLLDRLRLRSPAVAHILALAGGITWLGRVVLVLAFAAGISLSALDGSRRINILAFPLIGLILWNVLVYVLLFLTWIRHRGRTTEGFWSGTMYGRWIAGRIESLMRHSTRFNVPLSTGLRRFAAEWGSLSQPIVMLRAKRLLHLAAALLAIGLIVGLYVRGVVLRYEAGWESTFLGPGGARAVLYQLYGPASALSGIPIDDLPELRWTATGGGGNAAPWIHLIAITAVLYIVIPRLLLAVAASFGLWRFSRRPPVPVSLLGYARTLLMGVGTGTVAETASVVPYAYEPKAPSVTGLESLLPATLGGNLKVEVQDPIRYGEEETITTRLGKTAARWHVILMTLASTPEAENHGAFLTKWRDWLAKNAASTPLLILIDEGPYAARMRGEAAFEQRLQERRKLWREFIAGYGLRAGFADLIQIKPGAASEINARDEARAALWTAGERA